MLNVPFSPWPSFTEEESEAVKQVLLSNKVNYWTGQECREFEKEFAVWCHTEHAIALANGTVALDLALKALEIGPGDDVIVTPRTFLASVSSIINAGARPIFADVDLDSQNITAATIREVLTPNTRAVICVHLAGWPCDMDAIMTLAKEKNFFVIEDCAQAHGATYKGRPVGSIGHIGAWSFCQDKIMTTGGEGGMVTTNDHALWSRMWSYKDHGKSWEAVYERQHPPGFRWVHDSFGTNWRMTEMQAVLGRLQLRKIKAWGDARRANALALSATIANHSALRDPIPGEEIVHAMYKKYAFVRPQSLNTGWSRDRIIEELAHRGIPCYQGSCSEVYNEKAFEGTGYAPSSPLPNARVLGETSLMFLVHPTLTQDEIGRSASAITEVLKLASSPC
ncbi:DegT/DnrJ/EryC1/StrS family aminotransferase [Pigmentiphaga kullae]|uniref:dTDP-4-amino-4,6-dideoxygalactose transaminase n=1 Tax=Pigmentiphaga kullae TaxID=151784 RepID=A0A4Q7NM80_9BURK|nr:DegT/DnrJ/EryC1/StrS aminotransferase family protein [Pigmentiphaga kullae]RZS85986.1 dTDP-4-amino-4,6-dideoxygalactose transaminase [Pigmentiphaga kullae]